MTLCIAHAQDSKMSNPKEEYFDYDRLRQELIGYYQGYKNRNLTPPDVFEVVMLIHEMKNAPFVTTFLEEQGVIVTGPNTMDGLTWFIAEVTFSKTLSCLGHIDPSMVKFQTPDFLEPFSDSSDSE